MSWGSKWWVVAASAALVLAVPSVVDGPGVRPTPAAAAELSCPEGALPYVDAAGWTGSQCVDIVRPPVGAGPFPAVLFVHGGGWSGGSFRSWSGWRKDAAELAREHGFVAVTVEYDLASVGLRRAFVQEPKDIAAAIAFVRSLPYVDPARIGLVGDSAGGHLVLLSAWRDGGADPVEAVVSWSGPGDLAELTRTMGCGRSVCQPDPNPQWVARAAQQFEGSCLADPPLPTAGWRQCPDSRYRTTAPISVVGPGDPPALLAGATDDPLIPWNQHRALVDTARDRGVAVREVIVPGGRHGRAMRETDDDPPGLWAAETVPFLVDCVAAPPCTPDGVATATTTRAVDDETGDAGGVGPAPV